MFGMFPSGSEERGDQMTAIRFEWNVVRQSRVSPVWRWSPPHRVHRSTHSTNAGGISFAQP